MAGLTHMLTPVQQATVSHNNRGVVAGRMTAMSPLALIIPSRKIVSLQSMRHQSQQQQRQQLVSRFLVLVLTGVGHSIAITATTGFAYIHWYILESPRLPVDIQQIGPNLLDYFHTVQITCIVATALHALMLLYAVQDLLALWLCPSQRIQLLRSWTSLRSMKSMRSIRVGGDMGPPAIHGKKRSCWKRVYAQLNRTFSIYHSELTQIRLLIEVTMQTYQANKMSYLIASVWLNRVIVLVIILNCWFTPLIYALMRKHTPHERRLIRLSVDTFLDVVYCFGIPCVILVPYLLDFLPEAGSFPLDFYIRDTWTTVAGSELQQLFISSWWDFVSKVSPWFFFCYRLHALRRIVNEDQRALGGVEENARKTRVSRLLNNLLLASGLAVLICHLQTAFIANTSSSLGCLVEMRPWFATSHTCTVIEMSCSQRQISGTKSETMTALSEFTPRRVQALIVSHCAQFEMPPLILSFTTLALFKFYNTTICEWGDDAMLTTVTNPVVQQFFAIETNFSSFPMGLLSPDMSKMMRDVKFVATNLTTLPLELAQAWSSVKYFTLEQNAGLTEFPLALASMPELIYTAIVYGRLRVVSETAWKHLSTLWISFEGNPLTSLPEHIGNLDRFGRMYMSQTNISQLPASWLQLKRNYPLEIMAGETPLCLALQGNQANPPPTFSIRNLAITCNIPASRSGLYPVELERTWREENRYPIES